MKYAVLVLIVCSALAAGVCVEGHVPIEREYSRSEYVVTAKVVSARPALKTRDGYFLAGTFFDLQVIDVFKGRPESPLILFNENSSGRFDMIQGDTYLVFVYSEHGRNRIDNCGNSGLLKASEDTLARVRDLRDNAVTVRVQRPTIIAFFPPVTAAELENDREGTNEALDDFQYYLGKVQEQLRREGIDLHVLYVHSFGVRVGSNLTRFRPDEVKVGYYFVEPGRAPRVQYGVTTDDDILDVAHGYFGRFRKK